MFTGIVEERGEVLAVEPRGDSVRLAVRGLRVVEDARHGDSIAVNGVCLTVVDLGDDGFSADVMAETLRRSSLAGAAPGTPVNLERAVRPTDRLGGHLVQGHVDGTGSVVDVQPAAQWTVVRVALPQHLARYVVEKGSICVDGVSLTVSGVGEDWFEVSLIPTTLRETTLGERQVGDVVNLEVDVVAKYVEKLLQAGVRPAGLPGEAE